jgi:protein TonB
VNTAGRAGQSLTLPIGVSALLHIGVIASIFIVRAAPPPRMPPMFKVDLVAAPAGERAIGVVTDAPAPAVPAKPTPVPVVKSKIAPAPEKSTKTNKKDVKATPVVAKSAPMKAADAPKAGGGPVGDKGADVVGARTEGIVFPYQGYLDNITRQIALNFQPRGNVVALRCEVFFMINRDGSVKGFRFLTRSGSQAFDLEAQGAIEVAAKAFGGLPQGYADDVLPVIFRFDPSKLK